MSVLNDPRLEALLDRLHAQSSAQNEALGSFFAQRIREGGALDWKSFDDRTERFMADKFVALERDKAELCYQLCRALRASRYATIGTAGRARSISGNFRIPMHSFHRRPASSSRRRTRSPNCMQC